MTDIRSHIAYLRSQLESAYPADEAEALAWWIAEELSGRSRTQLLFECKDTTFLANTQTIIDRLLHFEPIQYIFGHTLWAGLDLQLSPATLIPRPETAELVERIDNCPFVSIVNQSSNRQSSNRLSSNRQLNVLDIGTGSGCIALALKQRHPEWQVTGIDISAEAIDIARQNALRNHLDVTFLQADIFSDSIEKIINHQSSITNHQYDLVVSNPPYICERERATMGRNVLDYEPASALFVPDDDPLRFYRRIAQLFSLPFREGAGVGLFFEINEAFAEEMKQLLREHGYTDIQIYNDIYGKPRIVCGRMAG